jgi:hypothetical protein
VARQTITTYVDDLDGRPIRAGKGGTVNFSLDGVDYEIDLSAKHRRALVQALTPFINHGRKVRGPKGGRRPQRGRPPRKVEMRNE